MYDISYNIYLRIWLFFVYMWSKKPNSSSDYQLYKKEVGWLKCFAAASWHQLVQLDLVQLDKECRNWFLILKQGVTRRNYTKTTVITNESHV